MNRRVFLLMGLAILAVVISHAAGWGQIAMFNWTDRYRPVTVPNYDQVGTLNDYILVVIRQLTSFAIPAFLFCSGFFVAFASRGARGEFTWRMVRARLINLLIPYLIWSNLWYVVDTLLGHGQPPGDYIPWLFTGMAAGGSYYFVPLMCQFFLLAPFIVRLAKTRPIVLLTVAGSIQAVALACKYLDAFHVGVPALSPLYWQITAPWLIFLWAFYFPLGVVCGLHGERIRQVVQRHYRTILLALGVSCILAILEPELIYRGFNAEVRFVPLAVSPTLYSLLLVVGFVMYDRAKVPLANSLYSLGGKSYGIYLIHFKAMELVSRLIRQVAPMLLTFPVAVIFPVTFVVGLAVPLLLMRLVVQTRLRKSYRYLFG
ncbi:MAG TPA: acyltransferase [Anaerolineae bacterium]|nr:acyltransferase [Anaerolineae bacterium]